MLWWNWHGALAKCEGIVQLNNVLPMEGGGYPSTYQLALAYFVELISTVKIVYNKLFLCMVQKHFDIIHTSSHEETQQEYILCVKIQMPTDSFDEVTQECCMRSLKML